MDLTEEELKILLKAFIHYDCRGCSYSDTTICSCDHIGDKLLNIIEKVKEGK